MFFWLDRAVYTFAHWGLGHTRMSDAHQPYVSKVIENLPLSNFLKGSMLQI